MTKTLTGDDLLFSVALGQLRKHHKVSQAALSEATGLTASAISKISHGSQRVSITQAVAWTAAVGVSLSDLVRIVEAAKPMLASLVKHLGKVAPATAALAVSFVLEDAPTAVAA